MNACGLFDIGCKVSEALAPVIFWGKVVLICLVVLAVLYGLWWIYRRFGWWGVGIALTAGAAAAIFKKGIDFGKGYYKPPPMERNKVLPPPKRKPKPFIDPKTNNWYELPDDGTGENHNSGRPHW